MALIRILLLALIAWLIFRMLKNWANKKALQQKNSQAELETMVRCQHCKLHIPKNEAIESDNKYYCSQEHLRIHQNDDPG